MKYVPGTWPWWGEKQKVLESDPMWTGGEEICRHWWWPVQTGWCPSTWLGGSIQIPEAQEIFASQNFSLTFVQHRLSGEMLEEELTVIRQMRRCLGVNALKDFFYKIWLHRYPRIDKYLSSGRKGFFQQGWDGINADVLQENMLLYLYRYWIQLMTPCP